MARGIRNKLGRHARLFIVVTGLTLIVAPVRVLAQPTTYAASCKIQIQAIGPGGAGSSLGDDPKKNPTETVGSFETMIELIHSPAMAARVAEKIKAPVEKVLGKVNASLITGTQVFRFTTVDTDAPLAAQLCNAYGLAFLESRLEAAKKVVNTALYAQRSRWAKFREDLGELETKIRGSSGREADRYRFNRLHLARNISSVKEEIANLEAVSGLGLAGSGSIIQPAGSTGAPVGPNRAFPMGLMVAGVGALVVMALIPRRRVSDEALKTY